MHRDVGAKGGEELPGRSLPRALYLLLISLVMYGASNPAIGQETEPGALEFTDIGGHHFEAEINWLGTAGVTAGCAAPDGSAGNWYCPSEAVTRGQMASFLARALGLSPVEESPFSDVAGTHATNINAVASAGISIGCNSDGTQFCPDVNVSREQMATFLARALQLPAGDGPAFSDVAGTHAASVSAIAEAGITLGCESDRFCPKDPVTRGQMAAFLFRSLARPIGVGVAPEEGVTEPALDTVISLEDLDKAESGDLGEPAGANPSDPGGLPTGAEADPQPAAVVNSGLSAPEHPDHGLGFDKHTMQTLSGTDAASQPFVGGQLQPLQSYDRWGTVEYEDLPFAVGQLLMYRQYGHPYRERSTGLILYSTTQWSNCSGTLVARNVVLTAAHCVIGADGRVHDGFYFVPDQYGVRDAERLWWGTTVTYHPEYLSGLSAGWGWAFDYALIALNLDSYGQYPGDLYPTLDIQYSQFADPSNPVHGVDTTTPSNWDGVRRRSIGYPTQGWFSQFNSLSTAWPIACESDDGLWLHWGSGYYSFGFGCFANGGASGGPILWKDAAGAWKVISVNSTMGKAYTCTDYSYLEVQPICGNGRYTAYNIWGPALFYTTGSWPGFDDLWRSFFPNYP